MRMRPAMPTIHCPPGHPSTPAADLCGLLELWLDVPSRIETERAHIAAYAQPLAAAEIRPNVDASPPPSGPWPTYAWTNRQIAYAPRPIATTIKSQWPSGCLSMVSTAPFWLVGGSLFWDGLERAFRVGGGAGGRMGRALDREPADDDVDRPAGDEADPRQ